MSIRLFRFRSLSVKFIVAIVAIVSCVGFTIGASVIVQDRLWFREALEEKSLLLARSVAVSAPEAILQNDSWSLYKIMRKIASRSPGDVNDTRVMFSMVLDPQGVVLAHINPADHPIGLVMSPKEIMERQIFEKALSAPSAQVIRGGEREKHPFVEAVVPVYSDQKKIGIVRMRLSTAELDSQTWWGAKMVLGITSFLVLAGSAFGAMILRRIVKPLAALAKGMESIGRGDFPQLAPYDVRSGDEIGQLAHSFRQMASELEGKKQLEQEMALNEKLVALGRISAGVAHEVNNPLAGILNCLDTLKKHPNDQELKARYLPLIEKGLKRIQLIVAGLLGELRVEDSQELSGPSCLNDIKELALVEIGDRPIKLNWDNRLMDGVELNLQHVQQIVVNLLKNAFENMPGEGTVNFRAVQDGDFVVLEVEDDGSGIAVEHRGRLFDPFFTTRPDGTGLGLWITYRLVRSMNGVLEVSSRVGEGTTFQVFLPARMRQLAEGAVS